MNSDRCLEIYEAIASAHLDDDDISIEIGEYFANAIKIDFLNASPPATPLAPRLIDKLEKLALKRRGLASEVEALDALTRAARLSGRRYDAVSESAYKRLLELEPNSSRHRYNFGLFLKTRGRFVEGMAENKRARELSAEKIDSYEWNFGICSTGAGDGAAALQVWKAMGQNIEIGKFELPDGKYSQCKVRLAERPLAERTAETDSPGEEETIWMERLSPCHGIIRSILFKDLGVNFGDVILIDGAPITYHRHDDVEVPVFPHLATLKRSEYQFFDFVGTQSKPRQLANLSSALTRDAVIYSHSESYHILCMDCWMGSKAEHSHSEMDEFNVVTGRIAAPPDMEPADLLRQIDLALPDDEVCRLFSPELCEAAGERERAKFELKRFRQLVD